MQKHPKFALSVKCGIYIVTFNTGYHLITFSKLFDYSGRTLTCVNSATIKQAQDAEDGQSKQTNIFSLTK
jgi:hypothetical protein